MLFVFVSPAIMVFETPQLISIQMGSGKITIVCSFKCCEITYLNEEFVLVPSLEEVVLSY